MLQLASIGGGVAAAASTSAANSANTMIVQTALNALKALLYWTSLAQEITNMVVDKLLEQKAVPRLVELVLDFPAVSGSYNSNNDSQQQSTTAESKQIINMALAILANLSRTEQGALELVGNTLTCHSQ